MPEVIKDERQWKVTHIMNKDDCPFLFYPINIHGCLLLKNEDDRACTKEHCPSRSADVVLSDSTYVQIDKCWDWVTQRIKADDIHSRSILFGCTVKSWLEDKDGLSFRITITGFHPAKIYETATLPDSTPAVDI